MSGLAGIIRVDGGQVAPEQIARLAAAYPHPVYDGVDAWRSGEAGLIKFALHTTPESVGETQPFIHADTGAALVFNGRVDNRDDLRHRLGADAPPIEAPDGRIVLAAFERYGDEAVHLLTGDYALALWRPREKRLYCARSPVGWRPFLWTFDGRRFAFASEPRVLVEELPLERRLNEGAVAEQLSGLFTSHTETLWRDIYRLPPGEALAVENGRLRTWLWNDRFDDLSDLSEAEHIERFRALFDDAVVAAHRSNGPVASQLSGGLDSSSVVCRSVDLHQAGRLSRRVLPISARFPGQTCDEGPWIESVYRKIGFSGESVAPVGFDPDDASRWCAETLQLPLRPNVLATLSPVCNLLMSRNIRVVLTGEGGDDWFNGSQSHYPDLFLKGRWGTLWKEAMDQGGGTVPGKALALLKSGPGPVFSRTARDALLRPHMPFTAMPQAWMRPEFIRRTNLVERWRGSTEPPALRNFAQRARYWVFNSPLRHVQADMVISYAARCGVEQRHPFHHLPLIHLAMGAAGGVLKRGGARKHLLREAMRGILPEGVRSRATKANFSTSMVDAVTQRLSEKPFEAMAPVRLGWVDGGALAKLHESTSAWTRSGGLPPFPKQPYGPVWNAVSMDIWLEHGFRI